jgi:hypothetical protein
MTWRNQGAPLIIWPPAHQQFGKDNRWRAASSLIIYSFLFSLVWSQLSKQAFFFFLSSNGKKLKFKDNMLQGREKKSLVNVWILLWNDLPRKSFRKYLLVTIKKNAARFLSISHTTNIRLKKKNETLVETGCGLLLGNRNRRSWK